MCIDVKICNKYESNLKENLSIYRTRNKSAEQQQISFGIGTIYLSS